jgi:hypothetical protein
MIRCICRRSNLWKRELCTVALAALMVSGGCSRVPEEGTIDPGAAGLKPQRVHLKDEKATPRSAESAKKER